jgi:hypothetical protein
VNGCVTAVLPNSWMHRTEVSSERRKSERKCWDVPATIRTEDATVEWACLIVNFSDGGAKLVVEECSALPSEFILFLKSSSPIGRRCQIVWQNNSEVGVRFVSTFNSEPQASCGQSRLASR